MRRYDRDEYVSYAGKQQSQGGNLVQIHDFAAKIFADISADGNANKVVCQHEGKRVGNASVIERY
jgi:hypothetical protein